MVNWLTKSGWGEVGIRFVILSIVVNNKIYVLFFDVLFDLSVRQFVFLRLSSKEIIQYHLWGMS